MGRKFFRTFHPIVCGGEAVIAVESAQNVTIIRYYCDYFFDYTHYFTTKSRIFGLEFIADYRPIA